MKFAVSSIVALLTLSQAYALSVPVGTVEVVQRSATTDCGYATVPLLRGYSAQRKDHFYTTSPPQMYSAIVNQTYVSQGDAAQVFPAANGPNIPGAVPLYRTFSPTHQDHFYTVSESQRDNAVQKQGYKDEGVTAYVYGSQVCGSIPFYRTFNPVALDHFYTVNETEKLDFIDNRGYVDEGNAGFVFPIQ